MSIDIIRGKSDATIDAIKAVLAKYERDHEGAQISLYRQNSVSLRVRIIDPSLDGKSKPERNDIVWKYLSDLSDDEQSDVSMLLLLTPSETKKSFANFEFEDAVPSKL